MTMTTKPASFLDYGDKIVVDGEIYTVDFIGWTIQELACGCCSDYDTDRYVIGGRHVNGGLGDFTFHHDELVTVTN